MRLLQKIFIFFFLLTLPLSVNSAEPKVLYLWQISSGHEWESYGDENVQQKYEGITSNGEPDGKGILSFPDGKRVTGEWKNGNKWNTDHFNNEGKLIGRTAKGKYNIGAGEKIKMVLFLRKVSGKWAGMRKVLQERIISTKEQLKMGNRMVQEYMILQVATNI